jgi:hypothetical protein
VRAHGDEVIQNGTQPPTTLAGCLNDGFWSYMLQDWAVQLEGEGDDRARRAIELLNWITWWEALGSPSTDDASNLSAQAPALGAGIVDQAALDALGQAADDGDAEGAVTAAAAVAASLRTELSGSDDGSGGDGFYSEFVQNAGVFETYGINAYGADGVLSEPKDTELTGVLEVWNPEAGEFQNNLQHWVPEEADFAQIATVNSDNVKNTSDGERLPYLINGFLFLVGGGHDGYADWAQSREEKVVEASIRGEVRVRKAGITSAGRIDVSDCPPMAQQTVIDAVARFSEKEVRFV